MPPDKRTDADLIDAARAGDGDAFAEIYHRYRDWTVRLAFRYCGHQEDALEVLQDSFAYVWKKIANTHLTAKMTTFLFPIVKNNALALVRRRRKLSTAEMDDVVFLPGESALEMKESLAKAMAGLSLAHRETLVLRFADGLSIADIAEAMDVPTGTVKSRLHEALRRCRAIESQSQDY